VSPTRQSAEFLPLAARDFYILFFLAQRERHGYGLVKAIDAHSDGSVRLDPANLYRAIQRLAADGLIADGPRKVAADSGRERRYYRITELGREVVAAEATRMQALAAAVLDDPLPTDGEH
jgi:DNA-binding PadR family transcriptional regulator